MEVLSGRDIFRIVTAFIVVAVLLYIGGYTLVAASGTTATGDEPSAVQVIQVYTTGAFYVLITVGLAIAVYIGTA